MSAPQTFDGEDARHTVRALEALFACASMVGRTDADAVAYTLNPDTLESVACLLGKAGAVMAPAVPVSAVLPDSAAGPDAPDVDEAG